jgi:hypothetical protein
LGKFGWYAREIDKFLAATEGWPFEPKACYGLVLDLIYDRDDGRLPDEPRTIARRLGLSVRKWNILRADLIRREKLIEEDGFLVCPAASRRISKRSHTGVNGQNEAPNYIKTEKKPEIISRYTQDNLKINEVVSAENNDLSQKYPPNPTRARASKLVESESEAESESRRTDFKISAIAKELGIDIQSDTRFARWFSQLAELEVADKLDFDLDILPAVKQRSIPGYQVKSLRLFRDHALRIKRDRLRHAQYAERAGIPATPPKAGDLEPKQWEEAVSHLLRAGLWDRAICGPTPLEPGYLGPGDLRARFLATWEFQGRHPSREYDELGSLVIFPADRPSPRCRAQWQPLKARKEA